MNVPQLVKTYNEKISGDSKVELVMISMRDKREDSLNWSKQELFPWPQILSQDISAEWEFQKLVKNVPFYLLLDKNGNKVADGKDQVFEKLAIATESK